MCCVCFSGFGQIAAPLPNLPNFKTGNEILSHIYNMDMSFDSVAWYAQSYNDSMPGDIHFNKRYGRWSDFWDSRVDVSGDFPTTFNNMLNMGFINVCTPPNNPSCNIGGNWKQTGPLIEKQNSGIIVTLASPDGQPNTIYAGSNTGGLWKTTNNGNTWVNLTDILGISGLGINDIIIHPTNPETLYVATGFNATFVPQNYGAGVLKSEDGGAHGITRFYTTGEKANDVTGNSQVDQVTDNTISDGCPSILEELDEVTIIAGRVGQINDYTTHEAAYNNSVYLYDNLIDGGNPQGLSNNIQFNWSNDAWQMRNELLAESPNLSEEILLDAAFTGTLPDALLMEVLLANPLSVRNPDIHEVLLNEIPNPLPQYMVDMLPFAAETPSVRATLEKQMTNYDYEKSTAAKLLVHYALRDSIVELDSVEYWLEKDNTPKGRFALAEHYLSRGQYTLAQNTLNNVATEFERYTENRLEYYQAYQQLMTLKVNILQNGRTWLDITESEKGQLQTIAYETNDDAAFQARNILCFFFDECVEEPIDLGNNTSSARIIQVEDPMLELTESLTNLKVYPNPATDYVNFDYELPEYVRNATVVITTMTGKIVQQFDLKETKGQVLWDTRSIENGIYFYALKQGTTTLASGKVSIIK